MQFERSKLRVLPLNNRTHDIDISAIRELGNNSFTHPSLNRVAEDIKAARQAGKATTLMIGAHVIRSGVQKYLIDLLEMGYISCIAMNGLMGHGKLLIWIRNYKVVSGHFFQKVNYMGKFYFTSVLTSCGIINFYWID